MSVPCSVQIRFGQELTPAQDGVNTDPVISQELKDRLTKLLTGKFDVDGDGNCIIPPHVPEGMNRRDSVCVEVDLVVVRVEYCKDL